jgi:hypothetical protein
MEVFMRRKFAAAATVAALVLVNGTTGLTHHSVAANFDLSKTLDVTGKIKEFDIRNPHTQITLEVAKPDGSVADFFVEWSDKNSLLRRSVPLEKIRVGDTVTVTVNPSRRLSNLGYFRTATLPDGSIVRDCGFGAFRESVAKGTKITC